MAVGEQHAGQRRRLQDPHLEIHDFDWRMWKQARLPFSVGFLAVKPLVLKAPRLGKALCLDDAVWGAWGTDVHSLSALTCVCFVVPA